MKITLKKLIGVAGCFLFLSCASVGSYYKKTKQQYTFDNTVDDIKPTKRYSAPFEPPIKLPNDFIWGINGHPIDATPYRAPGSIDLQMELLKEFQLSHYRINVTLNDEGEVDYWKGDTQRWEETLQKAEEAGVTIFPVILLRDFDFSISEEKAFTIAKKQTAGFARMYKEKIEHYALGNEMDLKLVTKGKDGSKIEHYDKQKFDVWIAFLKGMAAGIREEDPTAKLVINGAGRHYFGYYEYIKQKQVDYDLIGFHWYSEMGKIPEPYFSEKDGIDIMEYMHQEFEKPIWITEINQHWGVNKHSENHQSFWMDHFIDNLEGRDYIKAFFVYELFDEPQLDDGEGYENKRQAYFGLIDWTEPYTSYRYRPAAITYKYKIEEVTNGTKNYVTAVKKILEISDIDSNQIIYLINNEGPNQAVNFAIGKSKAALVKNASQLYKADSEEFIFSSFQTVLKRNPTEKEKKYWLKKIKKNAKPKSLLLSLLNSVEFYKNAIIGGYESRIEIPFYREGVYSIKQ